MCSPAAIHESMIYPRRSLLLRGVACSFSVARKLNQLQNPTEQECPLCGTVALLLDVITPNIGHDHKYWLSIGVSPHFSHS